MAEKELMSKEKNATVVRAATDKSDYNALKALSTIPALIAYVKKDLTYGYVNAAYQKWIGLDYQAIIGKSVVNTVHYEVYQQVSSYIEKVLKGEICQFEYAITRNDVLQWIDACYTPDIDAHNNVIGYSVLLTDVTKKRLSERVLKDYTENGNIGLHWVAEDGTIVWANEAELKMLGYRHDEYIGHHISEFHADQQIIGDILNRLSRNEVLIDREAIMRAKDGTTRNVLINSSVYRENGKFIHTRCFTIDITARKQAELNLRNSERKFVQLAQSLPVAFYTCDRDGTITYCNDVGAKLWRYDPDNSKTQNISAYVKSWIMDGVHVPMHQTPMVLAIQNGQSFESTEALIERRDGSRFYACANIEPIIENGIVTGAINVFQDITVLKSTELALRESYHRYREIIELLPSAVYTCDLEGRVKLFNKAAVDLWGRTPKVGIDMWCGSWKIFDPEDGSPVPLDTCPMAVALKEGKAVLNKEIIVERPDGSRRNVAPNPKPMFDVDGRLTGAVNMLIDITEQKAASKALKESEQKFRMIADLVPIIIWTTDDEGSFDYLNSQWEALTGKKVGDGLQNGWLNYIHPDDRDTVYRNWRNAFSERDSFNGVFGYRNAENNYLTHQASGFPRYDDNNNFIGYLGIFQDISPHITLQRLLESEVREKDKHLVQRSEELRESELRYHSMVAEVQDYAIILLNKDGIVENWNKGAEQIKGYTAEEAIGKHFRIFYTPEQQQNRAPEDCLKQATRYGRASYEGWRVRKDGSLFWGSVVLTAIHDAQNEIVGFSKVTRDLTERKLAEDELRAYADKLAVQNVELEKVNEELASFAYISSHDLQEPLRKIQIFADRILQIDEENFSPESKEYFARMSSAASRMRILIADLLAYSRATTAEKNVAVVDLNEIVNNVLTELKEAAEAKDATIDCSPLPIIPVQFQQLMINLLSNALKFARPGVAPLIKIKAEAVKGADISDAVGIPGKIYMCISVSDNGIGFEQSFSAKIFEIFQRLHNRDQYEGTGVGLAICKKIAENHNGFITAIGEVGKGATFNIYIPAE